MNLENKLSQSYILLLMNKMQAYMFPMFYLDAKITFLQTGW